MPSAAALTASIGTALFASLVTYAAPDVQEIALAEPGIDPPCEAGDLVLGVGWRDAAGARELVAGCAGADASGLVLRLPLAADPEIVAAAQRASLPLIGLQPGFSWAHVVWLLRTVLDQSAPSGPDVHSDLFALADAAAAIVDAPVTIEDSQSRVLAYSSGQSAADATRVSTIVGRRVPAAVVAHMRSVGVFRRLAGSDEPFLTPAAPDGTRPRLVVPVRAGDEWLGSIWAVRSTGVDAARQAQLRNAAAVVAVHLLRLRAQADVAYRETSERVRALLQRARAGDELPVPAPCRVVALAGSTQPSVALELWRATLRRHGWPQPVLADVDGTVFAVVSDATGTGTWPWLAKIVRDLHVTDPAARAAAGGRVSRAHEVPASRRQAAELLAALDDESPAQTVDDAWARLVVARAAAALRGSVDEHGPLALLRAHDTDHGTDHVRTLTAWLAHPGQPLAAARELHVHVNTLRYRMARLRELVALDLDDPTVRLALQLQLTVLPD